MRIIDKSLIYHVTVNRNSGRYACGIHYHGLTVFIVSKDLIGFYACSYRPPDEIVFLCCTKTFKPY